MKSAAAAVLILSLAACSGKPLNSADNKAAAVEKNEAQVDAALQNIVAVQGPDAVAPGIPVSKPSPEITDPNAIPPAFKGRWGLVAADCDLSRSDTKGLMVIGLDKIDFYESTARVTAIQKPAQNKVTMNLNYSGEGETWQDRMTLETVAGGTHLLRTDQSPAKTERYERC